MTTNIRDAVLAQLEEKITTGEALAAANTAVTEAQVHLTAVSAGAAKARQQALKAGWTEQELKTLGLIPTARAAKTRPPRPRLHGTPHTTPATDSADLARVDAAPAGGTVSAHATEQPAAAAMEMA